jgi:hypothetical protein
VAGGDLLQQVDFFGRGLGERGIDDSGHTDPGRKAQSGFDGGSARDFRVDGDLGPGSKIFSAGACLNGVVTGRDRGKGHGEKDGSDRGHGALLHDV